jgi:hypothetical protein
VQGFITLPQRPEIGHKLWALYAPESATLKVVDLREGVKLMVMSPSSQALNAKRQRLETLRSRGFDNLSNEEKLQYTFLSARLGQVSTTEHWSATPDMKTLRC